MKKITKIKYLIIELVIVFLITLININLDNDEIWNYGFAYNISNGLIPYKDFNMIITPLFPFLGSVFLSIFGKSLLVYHIFNTLICTTIFYLIKKLLSNTSYIVYYLFLIISSPNYNLFCVL